MNRRLKYYFYRASVLLDHYRSLTSFIIVFFSIVLLDFLFNLCSINLLGLINRILQTNGVAFSAVNMEFAPEVWLSLLGLVLGTLIIVISIASQNTPKLIDLYMHDWRSLFYIWFLVLSSIHAVVIMIFTQDLIRPGSPVLNIYLLLPVCILFSMPYIFYILRYTKANHVIDIIHKNNLKYIQRLGSGKMRDFLEIDEITEEFQRYLMECLNQLDNLLDYAGFKEPRAEVIRKMSHSIQVYVKEKPHINPNFFRITQAVRSDISFRTMVEEKQLSELEQHRIFFEVKSFRLLGNAYVIFLDRNEFDLASLCAAELTAVGETAAECNDNPLLKALIFQFNTMMRFAIKQATRFNEARNLYNLAFHYANFVNSLASHHQIDLVKECFHYFRMYGNEIFNHAKQNYSLYFIIAVLTAELKNILINIHKKSWDIEIQGELLDQILELDTPPDMDRDEMDDSQLTNDGVRDIQMSLALYYFKAGEEQFVSQIIEDILEDLPYLGKDIFIQVVENTFKRLENNTPVFWEDTDRGNTNLFYTPHTEMIEPLKTLILGKIESKDL
ncbi:MAG TPA: hypothetical protein QF355_09145 [Candidatus Marinimicrobia bacterium]|jgi:hypothetical protein|nr:hypothetical protein [Candidatus Neomarinimicrobiota bacterium]MDP6260458.1 hypothetical protein [Candidatus Neomarinimicrobiota bacterium]MDP7127033.1 hypothetical protein [Candidatus Neomarinimicrobiota bacterium]MDP7474538.1 hypothetical protein [Candidatus Neomarinimicrobiota bacterium]MEE1505566.1 hypothetical protein [Candidatus Neomarinimicrobiota bacterium]|tara:strand:+ start:2741 stop:4411 length:1671 start_codon:yes stop_codon:yes gene_type:complete